MRDTTDLPTANPAEMAPLATLERLFTVARPQTVFSEPVTNHDAILITASEVTVSMGMGFGSGTGKDTAGQTGRGQGGGGGGRTNARPVAVISLGPSGVRITPIVDVSRLALTAVSTAGVLLTLRTLLRRPKRTAS